MKQRIQSRATGPAGLVLALQAMGMATLVGCSEAAHTPPAASSEPAGETAAGTAAGDSSASAPAGHGHRGWWCTAHGVPERECGQCDARLAARSQDQGDWCAEHDRPDSQCFICHPEYAARFAARYQARYGEPPPPRSE
ncbi:MAG: RND transporter [Pirellulales bacterium]|nr:RND transporter [Pirellulales bacterium]